MAKLSQSASDQPRSSLRLSAHLLAILLALMALVCYIFSSFIQNYKNSIYAESAEHLEEISHQSELFIEKSLNSNWDILYAIRAMLLHADESVDLLKLLSDERAVFNLGDIYLYTENGYCISANGSVRANDVASELICSVMNGGEYLGFVNSTLTYAIYVDTELMYGGSSIAAVSLEQDLSSLIDDMSFSSFGNEARMYLTQSNGTIVSMLNVEGAPMFYNIAPYLESYSLRCITDSGMAAADALGGSDTLSYMMSDGDEGSWYLVSAPVGVKHASLRLFYIVPESAVNTTTDAFSSQITAFSAFVIILFILIASAFFLSFYNTRKRKFDVAILSRERMFNLLLSNTRNAFALLSTEADKPLYFSSNAKQILGYDYFLLKHGEAGFSLTDPEGGLPPTLEATNGELAQWDGISEFKSSYIPYSAGSDSMYYSIRLYPAEGSPTDFIAIAQDMTREYECELAIKNALEMADKASKAKTSFLANMSHDIRTPMNAIINMTDFAVESADKPEVQRGYLETIRESSEHLLRLINDILDMSRIESGKAVIAADPFDLRACLKETLDIIKPLCMAKHQVLDVDCASIGTAALLGDRMKLSQILVNLLNNAVKFTDENGRISFTAAEMPSIRADTVSIRFTVSDNGMGIAESKLPHIFEAFMRVDSARVSGIEGTGLGLSICKSYISAMGGTISVESAENVGSTFTVELPFAIAAGAKPTQAPESRGGTELFVGKRALLCEDNPINRTIAMRLLEKLGFTVETAADGAEGFERFRSSAQGYYDCIFMDIQMPVMDGYKAAAAIRACAHPQAGSIPIIAMTANVFTEDIEKARASGMTGHVGKPIAVDELINAAKRALGNTRQ